MKTWICLLAVAVAFCLSTFPVAAQGTAFTYQGRLTDSGLPANGSNDLRCAVYDSLSGGNLVSALLTNANTTVSNGIFTVTLDFGANVFSNTTRWLEIAVRAGNSLTAFTTLAPRQQITPAPQAMFAANVANGAVTAAKLSPSTVVADGSVLKINSGTLSWGADNNSGGTVTNLSAGTGISLTPNPIVLNGSVAIDTNVVPRLNATNTITGAEIIQSGNAAGQALVLRGAAAQTANLQEWRNNSGTTLASVSAAGVFSGDGSTLTNLSGTNIQPATIPASAIAGGQVVKSFDGFTDAVGLLPGNNINFSTNSNTIIITTAAGLLSWVTISGTSQTAVANKGYLLTNDTLTTLTLPASPAPGDIVRVSGSGSNGWKVAQNANQFIRIKNLPGNIGVNWTPHGNSLAWNAIASSADGVKLVATVSGGAIYTSTNSGATWTARIGNANWSSVASSADGNKLVAVVNGGYPYTSTNSGATWTQYVDSNTRNWLSVASSADGARLVAGVSGDANYISSDSGGTWTPYSGVTSGNSLADSAAGNKIVATVSGGQIFTSTDFGFNWTPRESARPWRSVASSADGNNLVAVVNGGQIYTSTDSGASWTAHDSNRAWNGVASSADGKNL